MALHLKAQGSGVNFVEILAIFKLMFSRQSKCYYFLDKRGATLRQLYSLDRKA